MVIIPTEEADYMDLVIKKQTDKETDKKDTDENKSEGGTEEEVVSTTA